MKLFNKTSIFLIPLYILMVSFSLPADFFTHQKQFPRVRIALSEKQNTIESLLQKQELSLDNFHVLIAAYKDTDQLEIYAKKKEATSYKKIKEYSICARSGTLGPKRKQGDLQVPEGFYHIDRFNPASNFFLSLGINYPNKSDKLKSNAQKLGGDIFIHGDCQTIGCLPMNNSQIKEIYLLAMYAKINHQEKIPVYIFPFKMTDKNMESYNIKYHEDKALTSFWKNLKQGYDAFGKTNTPFKINVSNDGTYIINP